MQPPNDLVVIGLVLRSEDAVSDKEIQNQYCAVGLELAGGHGGLYLFYGPEVEFLLFLVRLDFSF